MCSVRAALDDAATVVPCRVECVLARVRLRVTLPLGLQLWACSAPCASEGIGPRAQPWKTSRTPPRLASSVGSLPYARHQVPARYAAMGESIGEACTSGAVHFTLVRLFLRVPRPGWTWLWGPAHIKAAATTRVYLRVWLCSWGGSVCWVTGPAMSLSTGALRTLPAWTCRRLLLQ